MIGALFSGQGSQHIGMAEYLIENHSLGKQVFEEASDTLGFDLARMCLKGDEQTLALTYNTQPALLATSFATYSVTQSKKPFTPAAGAGHSVGEYAALVCAGVLSFADGIRLVRLRGELMQKSVPVGEGGMLAVIGLEAEEVLRMCEWAQKESGLSPIEPANYNSPTQIVVSGSTKLISWVQENFTAEKIQSDKKKVRLIPLKVSAPFHCSMMETAQKEMAMALNETAFSPPQWAIAQNFTGQIETDPQTLKINLTAQISGAVKWTDCIESLKAKGVGTMVEFGPGKVLTGLLKKIDPTAFKPFNLNSEEDLTHFTKHLEASS